MPSTTVRKSALTTLGFHWGGYLLQLASLIALTRILSPADYGLITMATAITGIAAVLGDFGLSLAAVQAPFLSQQQKSNLFWMNTAIGVGTGALVALASPAISAFYGEPRLESLTMALALVFVFNGVAVQFKVELNRASRFATLGRTELGAQAFSFIAAIGLALAGSGYWALVAQQLLNAVLIGVLAAGAARWRPTRPGHLSETRKLIAFGRDTLALQITNYVTSNIDSVMIGRAGGAGSLGLYNRAYQVTVLPIMQVLAPLTRVFLPRLSAAGDEEFTRLVYRLQTIVTYVTLGPLSLLCALSQGVPVLLFGSEWAPLGQLIPALSVGTFFGSLGFVFYWAFLARAKTFTLFLSELTGRVPMVVLIVLSAPDGPVWVAASVSVGQAIIWASSTFVFGRRLGLRPSRMLSSAARPVIVFVTAYIASICVQAAAMPPAGSVVPNLLVGASCWVLVTGVFMLAKPFRNDVRLVLANVRRSR